MLQIIIVQLADVAFATKGLTLEQWLWCVFLGAGTLLWGQVRVLVILAYLIKKYK